MCVVLLLWFCPIRDAAVRECGDGDSRFQGALKDRSGIHIIGCAHVEWDTMPSIFHEAALDYAASGIPVFPCHPGTKTPACPRGFHDATTNQETINEWWNENPDRNVAISPGVVGLAVIDTDPPEGEEQWNAVCEAEGQPTRTYTVVTPRGGRHRYYQGRVATSQHKIASRIDTRGIGGYVLVPPSVTPNGSYQVEDDTDPAPLPEWVTRRLRDASKGDVREGQTDVAEDDPASVARAVTFLRRHPPLVEGAGSDAKMVAVFNWLYDWNISRDKAVALVMEHLDCTPKDEWWVQEKADNARRYRQNSVGIDAVTSAAATFAGKLGLTVAKPKRSRFYPEDEDEQEQGADPAWLIPDLMPDKGTVLLLGATQSYKSFIAVDLALSVAANITTFAGKPCFSGPVFYAASEGRTSLKKARRRAWKAARGIAKVAQFYVMPGPMVIDEAQVQEFGDQIHARLDGRRPAMIVIDTAAKVMLGLNENDSRDSGRFVQFCDSLAEEFDCVVLVVHHTGKDKDRGARGSSAIHAGFDTVLFVEPVARAAKIVQLTVLKHKDAEENERPWYLQGERVAGSLAFHQITAAEFRRAAAAGDPFAPSRIGRLLRELRAIGRDNARTTFVVASRLCDQEADEKPEDLLKRVQAAVKELNRRARTTLAGYCQIIGRDVLWFMPDAAQEVE